MEEFFFEGVISKDFLGDFIGKLLPHDVFFKVAWRHWAAGSM